ncbi:MAG: glycosyltransferase family 2 protein [Desulfamplus sp.]|nr:glycosyltransferase family 2 protein [Desulfamplus sp.]
MEQKQNIKFSIVIPLYNKEKEIKRAIDSVLNQTLQEFELIIVDDGSIDKSASIVRQYNDGRIKFIQQKNAGVSAARNTGIANCRNDYIAFLDADDEWKNNHLAIINNLIHHYPDAGVYATLYQVLNSKGRKSIPKFSSIPPFPWEGILLPSYFSAALEGEPVCSSTAVIPKSVLLIVGNFATTTSMGEDKDLWERIAIKYPIAFSNQIGATYFLNSNNRISKIFFNIISKCPNNLCSLVEERSPRFYRTAQEAILRDEVSRDVLPDLIEYLKKYALISAEFYIKFAGKPQIARKILKTTYPKSKTLLKKKFMLYTLSFLPLSILKLAMAINTKLNNKKHA